MSRVFEALEKASKESGQQVARPASLPSKTVEPKAEAKVAAKVEPRVEAKMEELAPKRTSEDLAPRRGEELSPRRIVGDTNGKAAAAPFAPPARTWRMAIEELFFGRDLRDYKAYPLVALDKGSPAADQYKILREQIRRLRVEKGIRTISITSPVKQDGKSTVAANLAAAIALEKDERVLLIDCDLRRPQIHQYFGLQGGPGLTELLLSSSNGSLGNYVKETFLPGLKFIPAGQPLALSSELLATEKMRTVMEGIRAMFPDYQIIIDSPPILSTPDPLVLAGMVEGIIMVLRAGQTPRDCLSEALGTLKSEKILGIVLNGADLGMASKYYYY